MNQEQSIFEQAARELVALQDFTMAMNPSEDEKDRAEYEQESLRDR